MEARSTIIRQARVSTTGALTRLVIDAFALGRNLED